MRSSIWIREMIGIIREWNDIWLFDLALLPFVPYFINLSIYQSNCLSRLFLTHLLIVLPLWTVYFTSPAFIKQATTVVVDAYRVSVLGTFNLVMCFISLYYNDDWLHKMHKQCIKSPFARPQHTEQPTNTILDLMTYTNNWITTNLSSCDQAN